MRRAAILSAALACAAQSPLRLWNGLPAVLLEQHESPLLRVEVRVPVGPEDLPERPGLPHVFLRTLMACPAGNLSPEAFATLLDQSGIRLDAWVDHGGLRLSLLARNRDQELALSLLADLLMRNSLEAKGLPSSGFTLDDLMAFRARVLRPDRVRLVLAGDLTPAQARQVLHLSLGAWKPEASPATASTPSPQPQPAAPEVLPLPPAPLQPLVAFLMREALTEAQGSGLPGDPWVFKGDRRAAARTWSARDLERAKTAYRTSRALIALDPAARLADLLDPGPPEAEVLAADLPALQQAWDGLFR